MMYEILKNKLHDIGIHNAITLLTTEDWRQRSKIQLSQYLGRKNLAQALWHKLWYKHISVSETIELSYVLWWDLQDDLKQDLADKNIYSSLDLLEYRNNSKNRRFYNKNYINLILYPWQWPKPLNRLVVLEFAKKLWWNLYDEIIKMSDKKWSVTNVLLHYFWAGSDPFHDIKKIVSVGELKLLKQRVVTELIYDMNHNLVTREIFQIRGRNELESRLKNINLRTRLRWILGEPVDTLTLSVKRKVLNFWPQM